MFTFLSRIAVSLSALVNGAIVKVQSFIYLRRLQARSETSEHFFSAWNGETAHRMIEPELLLSLTQQVQEQRMLHVRLRHRNNISLLLGFTCIYWKVAFSNIRTFH